MLRAILSLTCLLTLEREAHAFVHVVQPGETLAQIAQRIYGNTRYETVLAAANFLDSQGGSIPVAGMRLEIPHAGFVRVAAGQSWYALAGSHLGDSKRADVLARANHASSWIPPVEGQEIEIPYNLTILAGEADSVIRLAERFYNNANRAWEINAYNGWTDTPKLKRGDVLLLPLVDLPLTEEGRAERNATLEGRASSGSAIAGQRRAEAELPIVVRDLRAGRFLDATARANRLLSLELTPAQVIATQRALVESYVALDAVALARGACTAWQQLEPGLKLNPNLVSPKVIAACSERSRAE